MPAITILEPDGVDDVADPSFTITWWDDVSGRDAEIFLFYDNDSFGYAAALSVDTVVVRSMVRTKSR